MSAIRMILALCGILSAVFAGCGHKPEAQAVQSAAAPVVEAQPPAKQIAEDEFTGIVFDGWLWKDLRQNEFDSYPLYSLCRDLNIPVEVPPNPSKYRDVIIPYQIKLGDGGGLATLTLDTGNDKAVSYMKFPEGANGTYLVSQDGHAAALDRPPFTHHGGGPMIDLDTFLNLVKMNHSQKDGVDWIGVDHRQEIRGKVLFNGRVSAGKDAAKTEVRLEYVYDPASKPRYRKIELVAGQQRLTLFDQETRGSSDYYVNGYAEEAVYRGESFLQINLDEDTLIYKQTANGWQPIFSSRSLSSPPAPVAYFETLTVDDRSESFLLKAQLSAGKGISEEMVLVYDGRTFVPKSVTAWDEKKYGADKSAGKDISSMDDYRLFSRTLP